MYNPNKDYIHNQLGRNGVAAYTSIFGNCENKLHNEIGAFKSELRLLRIYMPLVSLFSGGIPPNEYSN